MKRLNAALECTLTSSLASKRNMKKISCLLLFTCNYVASVWRGFLFLWLLGMGYVILLWHSPSLPYNYFESRHLFKHEDICKQNFTKLSSTFRIKKVQFGYNACQKQWLEYVQFSKFTKKQTPSSTQHNFVFSCSEDVKLSYQRQSFCQF